QDEWIMESAGIQVGLESGDLRVAERGQVLSRQYDVSRFRQLLQVLLAKLLHALLVVGSSAYEESLEPSRESFVRLVEKDQVLVVLATGNQRIVYVTRESPILLDCRKRGLYRRRPCLPCTDVHQ